MDGWRMMTGAPAQAALSRWVIDSATDFAMVATDREGRVTVWSAGAERILGWTETEMLGETVERIFTPEDRTAGRPAEEMRCAVEQGAGNDERWHLRKDGERFWANGEMTPLRDEAGDLQGFVKVLRDRTEQHIRVRELAEERDGVQRLLDSMAEGFYAVDETGATTRCNRAFLQMMGFEREQDVLGVRLHDVIHHSFPDGSHHPRIECPIYVCARVGTRAHVMDDVFFPVNGAPLPVEYWVNPVIRDGQVRGAICTFLDTSDRKAAEAARDASEARLRALNADLEHQIVTRVGERALTWSVSPDLFSVIDLVTGTLERLNPAWEKVLGWSEAEMTGRSFTDFLHPEDAAASEAALAQVRGGDPLLNFENRYRTRLGDWRWLSWVAVPYRGKLYSSARDVTVERRNADDLATAEDALRQSQKMEAVGQLTGGVAHDFNNLLTVIRGSVELLRRPGLEEGRRRRYIDAIGETAERAAKLTGQLLAFARRQALKPEVFDCAASIEEVASIIRTLMGSKVVLQTLAADEPCFIRADRSQFDTAVVNMSINARDAMQGEGRLVIASGPVSGIPSLRNHPPVEGDFVAVAITDSGAGIAAEDVAHIFEPFFTTKEVGRGTGLGLSQVFGFAKQSGGDIRVDSTPGQGSTFTLYLPRVSEEGADDADEAEPHADVQNLCVLVVEDNDQVGDFAVEALRELGHQCVRAVTGEQALQKIAEAETPFDIVFSDVVMPGMSGLELAQEIRRTRDDLPVILTSGYSHVLAQNGAHGFELLHKPYSIGQLSRVLQKAARWKG